MIVRTVSDAVELIKGLPDKHTSGKDPTDYYCDYDAVEEETREIIQTLVDYKVAKAKGE